MNYFLSIAFFSIGFFLTACASTSVVTHEEPTNENVLSIQTEENNELNSESNDEENIVIRLATDQMLAQNEATMIRPVLTLQSNQIHRFELTLSNCHFEEAEPSWNSNATTAEECQHENLTTFSTREQQVLMIPAGQYEILIKNPYIDRELGFWLRSMNHPENTLATGGGIGLNEEEIFDVQLLPGSYLYSCPVSPTPDYLLVVQEANP